MRVVPIPVTVVPALDISVLGVAFPSRVLDAGYGNTVIEKSNTTKYSTLNILYPSPTLHILTHDRKYLLYCSRDIHREIQIIRKVKMKELGR